MSLTHALLGVLEARPMSGYDLTRFFNESMNWVWTAPQSQIYPRLRKMEEQQLISGEVQVRGEKLERTVYFVTDQGHEELVRWVTEVPTPVPQRDAMFLRGIFFDVVESDDAKRVLNAHIVEQESLCRQWEQHRQALLAKSTPLLKERLTRRDPSEHDRIARLKAHVFAGQVAIAEARIQWARDAMELLDRDG